MKEILFNFYIATEALLINKLRSVLTALGIIFGVSAVIAMLAIGNGAQQEILDQMKMIGVNNIIVTPIVEQTEKEVSESDGKEAKKYSPGLTLKDRENIIATLPEITHLSSEIVQDSYVIKGGIQRSAKIIGVEKSYFSIFNFDLDKGSLFTQNQQSEGNPVCIIGSAVAKRFFTQEDPMGKLIKCGDQWLTVVGILKSRAISGDASASLGIRNIDMDVYIPMQTMLIRYIDRAKVTQEDIKTSNSQKKDKKSGTQDEEQNSKLAQNNNQLDRLVIQIKDSKKLAASAEVIHRILNRRHNEMVDYEITIPELLLKQQQRTKDIFNIVLGTIAGISLVVGGIGIMNIMLASVLERIREIGLRLALGARRKDIIMQFLFESMLISLTGGILGIILGIAMALGIAHFAEIPTIISLSSIVISFGVAAMIGILFGIAPARKAAYQDPIESLRYQ